MMEIAAHYQGILDTEHSSQVIGHGFGSSARRLIYMEEQLLFMVDLTRFRRMSLPSSSWFGIRVSPK